MAMTRWASSLETIRGQMNEFHWLINVRMPMVAMAFLFMGIMTRSKYRRSPQPSTLAARYSTDGTCMKYSRIM